MKPMLPLLTLVPLICSPSNCLCAADNWAETLSVTDEPLTNIGRNAYCVLEPGWQLVLSGKEDGEPSTLTITVLDDIEVVNGVATRVLEERETVNGRLIEVSRNFVALGVQTKHLYYFGEDVDEYRRGKLVSHGGAWRAGVKNARHGILLPGTPRVGDRYYQEHAPGEAMDRAENVSTNATFNTPAGKFTGCLKVKETTPLEPGNVEYKHYAPGIGLIQDGRLRLVKYGFKAE